MLGLAMFLWLQLYDLRFEDLLIAVHGDSGMSVRVCCLSRVMTLSQLDLITEPWEETTKLIYSSPQEGMSMASTSSTGYVVSLMTCVWGRWMIFDPCAGPMSSVTV
jgi:hypothetical protein